MRQNRPLALAAVAAAAAAPLLARAATYTNPVIAASDTPDPGVAWDAASSRWFAATTTGNAPSCFSLHSSATLGDDWVDEGHLFAAPPAWMRQDAPSCWAPELHLVDGRWVAVFVGRTADTGLLSVGVAWSTTASPRGPWVDSGAPLVTDSGADAQGQIDPT